MSDKPYNVLVFIGRFQPFHNGHKRVIDRALELADNVLVLVGSSNRSRSIRNPFTFEERKDMIERTYSKVNSAHERVERYVAGTQIYDFLPRVKVRPLDDVMYNDDRWIEQVQRTVTRELLEIANRETPNVYLSGTNDIRVGLIGCEKDHTSYYLKLFPTWGNEGVEFYDPINATDIRDDFFKGGENYETYVPLQVYEQLEAFRETDTYVDIVNEIDFIGHYKLNVHKYPRIEHTVDAVVIQSGHVLLIRRRAEPGKGMWALPGGFVDPQERLVDAAVRELREETKIKVPEPVLRGSIVSSNVFDDPNRSSRGRIITQAFLFRLTYQTQLPRVKGSDDADRARWVPLAELRADELYEDHYFIIQDLVGEL